jgi:hypothetical protein
MQVFCVIHIFDEHFVYNYVHVAEVHSFSLLYRKSFSNLRYSFPKINFFYLI